VRKKKDKIDEKRTLNSKWEETYFCAEQGGKPQVI
jgi:hypothetical protein